MNVSVNLNPLYSILIFSIVQMHLIASGGRDENMEIIALDSDIGQNMRNIS